MATLIFDIETKASNWNELPGITRASLTSWIEKGNYSDEEKNQKLNTVKSKLSLSPFTASIISLAVYDVERKTGAVYYVSDEKEEDFSADGFVFKQRDEKGILEEFWEGAISYNNFVTFNGRSFTLPFLYHRSVVCDVKPTSDIARQRYVTKQTVPYHVDLLDELSFHGAMAHRPSLQLLCGAYGVENASLLGGEEVEEAYQEKRFKYIAEKNAGDVMAIAGLYDKWKEFMAPRAFINAVEDI